ncbi:hypothetical protein ANN_21065 [Periplaneta americana]|uniref:Tc1-like transposase DDE domain-containing protein n=1 Tax=Periplaneta americana TaxID=6978 RepID=A0ABQ8SEC1_PERAM|nr:hypothetical protein ANN_21065 [Periplaneta americana]
MLLLYALFQAELKTKTTVDVEADVDIHCGAYHSFKSKSTNDPYKEMNAVNSKHWFENKLLPNIPQNSIIVMDNASYHSVQLNKTPTSASSKSDMQSWLRQNNIEYDPKATKIVLYDIIKLNEHAVSRTVILKEHKDYRIKNQLFIIRKKLRYIRNVYIVIRTASMFNVQFQMESKWNS